ncbi:hypothetical protein [Burkholderia lata]|uniref:Uncharacterized protein n=1 Tax=Burkholderia lata (strain ATCC 17760 / DSM 23089 / LMG 22485 / NCIMB 9086 / R18194 / 383) TaxID=482957 RepID=A0A6P2KY96_BURL3|nr:hypothetical protein [Burkholderia lata]VWB59671.1 hypothetical protein BLA6863_02769 [Burkholderia lata]
MSNYVKYGTNIRISNLYGGEGSPSYLGINTKQTTNITNALDPIGTYKSFNDYVNETQWTIGLVESSGDGNSVYSGDTITLVNASDGGNLALFNSYPPSDSGYPVATTTDTDDPLVTINWSIIITTKKSGKDVGLNYEDNMILVANFNTLAGVLDTNGAGNNKPFQYLVTGSRLANRDGGSGTWKVLTVQG